MGYAYSRLKNNVNRQRRANRKALRVAAQLIGPMLANAPQKPKQSLWSRVKRFFGMG